MVPFKSFPSYCSETYNMMSIVQPLWQESKRMWKRWSCFVWIWHDALVEYRGPGGWISNYPRGHDLMRSVSCTSCTKLHDMYTVVQPEFQPETAMAASSQEARIFGGQSWVSYLPMGCVFFLEVPNGWGPCLKKRTTQVKGRTIRNIDTNKKNQQFLGSMVPLVTRRCFCEFDICYKCQLFHF